MEKAELEATLTHMRYSLDLLHARDVAARAKEPITGESIQVANAWRWLQRGIKELSEHCLPQEEEARHD